ncbi:hypothetical protein P3H15_27220 [Rhodococcus sp. T2V]|uniref:hypothetical protein n=1 Tax=Rhodococcus sp. T2V TaxID=3034164 RepID=UPI0023E171E2|nr:hypothetical protein [Rhodococcus sp. T2V]MDF3308713.1 hypothetical protein [Rhodococcus sp. T2V]
MRIVLPYPPGAVREYLIGVEEFTDLIPASLITTRDTPDVITRPFALIRPVVTPGKDPMLRRPMVQVDVYSPDLNVILASADPEVVALFGGVDPEESTWNIAALAGELLGRARQQTFRNCTWAAEWKEGPLSIPEKTRGEDIPLFRSPVRVELKMLVR